MIIAIDQNGWTSTIAPGGEGIVRYQLRNPLPITDVQVRLGALVASEIPSSPDLRAVAGQKFSVPRVPGTYILTVWAKDSHNCENVTTLARMVTVK